LGRCTRRIETPTALRIKENGEWSEDGELAVGEHPRQKMMDFSWTNLIVNASNSPRRSPQPTSRHRIVPFASKILSSGLQKQVSALGGCEPVAHAYSDPAYASDATDSCRKFRTEQVASQRPGRQAVEPPPREIDRGRCQRSLLQVDSGHLSTTVPLNSRRQVRIDAGLWPDSGPARRRFSAFPWSNLAGNVRVDSLRRNSVGSTTLTGLSGSPPLRRWIRISAPLAPISKARCITVVSVG
jgi:hypothetical protein